MSEAYQYALWRLVADAQRGERVNVGLVLYSPRLRFLGARADLDRARVTAVGPDVDVEAVAAALDQRLAIAGGMASGGPVASLEAGDRFGFLVAPTSTVVQPGPVHTGLCADAERTLERLFGRLVLR